MSVPACNDAAVTVALREPLEGRIAPGHEACSSVASGRFRPRGRWREEAGSSARGRCGARRRPQTLRHDRGCGRSAARRPRRVSSAAVVRLPGLCDHRGPALRPRRLPPFALAYYDHLLRLDPEGRWWFEALWTPERDAVLRARRDEFAARLAAASSLEPGDTSTAEWRMTPSPAGHARAVAAARERIVHGDLYQANVATRLESTLTGEPADLFARVVARLAPDRAAFLQGAGARSRACRPRCSSSATATRCPAGRSRAPAGAPRCRRRRSRRVGGEREGPRGERHDRRSRPKRPRAHRALRHRARAGAHVRGSASRCVAPRVGGRGGPSPGNR